MRMQAYSWVRKPLPRNPNFYFWLFCFYFHLFVCLASFIYLIFFMLLMPMFHMFNCLVCYHMLELGFIFLSFFLFFKIFYLFIVLMTWTCIHMLMHKGKWRVSHAFVMFMPLIWSCLALMKIVILMPWMMTCFGLSLFLLLIFNVTCCCLEYDMIPWLDEC